MIVKNIQVKDLNRAISIAKALLYLPGADTALTLRAKGSKLYITADTAGTKIRATIECKVEKKGECLVDMNHLSAPHLRGKELTLKKTGTKLDIRCSRSLYSLSLIEGESVPVRVPKPGKNTLQLPVSVLGQAIKNIWFSHGDDGTGDLRFVWSKGKLLAETADAFKGCTWTLPMPLWKNIKKPVRVVLKKQIADVVATSFNKDEQVYVDITDSNLRLYTDDALVSVPHVTTTNLLDVKSTIKSRLSQLQMRCGFHIDSEELSEIAYAAASVVEETAKLNSVQTFLTINGSKKEIAISAEGDIGSFSTKAKISEYKSTTKKIIKVAVLSKQLKDLVDIAAKTGKEIKLEVWSKSMVILRNVEGDFQTVCSFQQVS